MKILLDECVTKRLKRYLLEFEVFTVSELRLSGIKNGQLMAYCVENSFDILLTIDKNLMFQQNLAKYPVTIIVLNCSTSKIEDIAALMPSFISRIFDFEKYKAYIIEQ